MENILKVIEAEFSKIIKEGEDSQGQYNSKSKKTGNTLAKKKKKITTTEKRRLYFECEI